MFNANFQPLAELISSGKSGSFFYYTSDGKFVLKTISRTEFKFIKRILQSYHQYLTVENRESIISKIYGLHKIIFYRKKTAKLHKKVYFAIMNNVFHTHMKIDKRFDLKGSTQGRATIQKEGEKYDTTIALKDLDFIRMKEKFKIDGDLKKRLLETIKKDVSFFAKCEIIDYSLLVGIH
jgi:1-phosphatidylinositol-4-phosphate 5-kinase